MSSLLFCMGRERKWWRGNRIRYDNIAWKASNEFFPEVKWFENLSIQIRIEKPCDWMKSSFDAIHVKDLQRFFTHPINDQ